MKEPEIMIIKVLYSLVESGMQYLGYVLLAVAGGFANHIRRLRTGEIKSFKVTPLLIDLFISGFAGSLVALLANYFELPNELVYFLAGISGHLGARSIFILQIAASKKIEKLLK